MNTRMVYAMLDRGGNRIKIGVSDGPHCRVAGVRYEYRCDAILIAEMLGDYREERDAHRTLPPWNCGGEWFRDCRAVRRFIDSNMGPPACRGTTIPYKRRASLSIPKATP